MKYEELCAALAAECEPGCDYVVQISSSYNHELLGAFGECTTYANKSITYKQYAVNLKTGVAESVKDDEKVRVVEGKMIIG